MQNQFVEDLLDLIRLRVKPLLHYSYPWWQPALLVTLLGVFSAAMAEQFSATKNRMRPSGGALNCSAMAALNTPSNVTSKAGCHHG
jgi:di/tripeptidase